MHKPLWHLFSSPVDTRSLAHQDSWWVQESDFLNNAEFLSLSLSRDHRVGQQERAQVHALHHLPLRSADGPDAVRWPPHLRCGDPLWGERPLSLYLPSLPPTRQGAAEPHTCAARNQPCCTTLHPHPRQWHQGGKPPAPNKALSQV